jgi:hypothetical protein
MEKPCMSRFLGRLMETEYFGNLIIKGDVKYIVEMTETIENNYEENIPEPYKTDFINMKKEMPPEAIKRYEEDVRADKQLYKDG